MCVGGCGCAGAVRSSTPTLASVEESRINFAPLRISAKGPRPPKFDTRIRAQLSPSIRAASPLAPDRRRCALPRSLRQSDNAAGGGGRGHGPGGPVHVGYVVVQQGTAPIEQELPGRVSAYQASEVRPQVSGVITKRLFQEGSMVRQGQTLYQIDPSVYQAQAAQAPGQSAKRPGQCEAARTLAQPLRPAGQACRRSRSRTIRTPSPRRARPMPRSRRTLPPWKRPDQPSLYPRARARFPGRIGLSNVTEGALVTANQTDALTTITQARPGVRRHPGIGGGPPCAAYPRA